MTLRVLDLFSGYTIREDGLITSRFGRPIKEQVGANGYVRVELWRDGVGKKYLLHRLVAQTFVPNPERKPHVNHKDGDKSRNVASNLEWVTQSENQLHAYATGLQRGYKKSTPLSSEHRAALCGSRWARETHIYSVEGERFTDLKSVAVRHAVSRQTVLNRCKSERWPSWSKTIERR